MEGFIMTAKDQCLPADAYKAKINKVESNLTCCLCHKFDETFRHIVSVCLLVKKNICMAGYASIFIFISIRTMVLKSQLHGTNTTE